MTKQRRSFFVDDILHMVMPINKNTDCPNECKRRRSITPDDGNRDSNKKFRSQNHEEEQVDNNEFKHSKILDILEDGGTGEEESCISDNSNSIDNNSGKLRKISDE
jgi:hypothetical protein